MARKKRTTAKKKPAVPAFAKLTITELNKKMAAIRKKRSNHKADGTLKAGPRKTIRQLGAYKGARRMKYKAPAGGRHK